MPKISCQISFHGITQFRYRIRLDHSQAGALQVTERTIYQAAVVDWCRIRLSTSRTKTQQKGRELTFGVDVLLQIARPPTMNKNERELVLLCWPFART